MTKYIPNIEMPYLVGFIYPWSMNHKIEILQIIEANLGKIIKTNEIKNPYLTKFVSELYLQYKKKTFYSNMIQDFYNVKSTSLIYIVKTNANIKLEDVDLIKKRIRKMFNQTLIHQYEWRQSVIHISDPQYIFENSKLSGKVIEELNIIQKYL